MSFSIKTPADWWEALDAEWDDLVAIVAHKIDLSHAAYMPPGKDEARGGTPTGRTISAELDYLRTNRTAKAAWALGRYFNAAWGMASDAYAWSVPGWGTLCDLCSEEWVFQGDYEKEGVV